MIKLTDLKNKHFLALTGNLVISVFSLITMSLLYRSLSKQEVGIWFLFLGIQSLAEAIRAGFLSTAAVKFYAGTEKSRGDVVLGSVWFIALFITFTLVLLNGCLLLFLPFIHNPDTIIILKWIGITFISSLPFTVPIWILMADEDYTNLLWLRLVNSISMFIIIVILIYLKKMNLQNLFILNLATNLLTGIYCVLFRLTHLSTIFKRTKSTIIEISNFGKFTIASSISIILFGNVSTFIITYFLGPAALAVYNLPGRLMTIIELPLGSSVGTGMSAMASALNKNNKEEFLSLFKKYAGILTFAIIPIIIFVLLFADLAVNIIGGAKYTNTEAANIFRVMIFFSILYPIDRFHGVVLDMLHLPQVNFQKILVMLIFTVIGSCIGYFIFHNLYGIVYFTRLSILSGILFGYYSLRKHLKYTFLEIINVGWRETTIILKSFLKK